MSKIKELLQDNNAILVFDVDGVLARIEYGEYNHYYLNDEEWNKIVESGKEFYSDSVAIDTMKEYLKTKDMNNIYVCTKVMNELEGKMKISFLKRNYNIIESHIYYVYENKDKLYILNKIKELNKDIPDNKIALIDDTVDNLTYVMENSSFATIHVSSLIK